MGILKRLTKPFYLLHAFARRTYLLLNGIKKLFRSWSRRMHSSPLHHSLLWRNLRPHGSTVLNWGRLRVHMLTVPPMLLAPNPIHGPSRSRRPREQCGQRRKHELCSLGCPMLCLSSLLLLYWIHWCHSDELKKNSSYKEENKRYMMWSCKTILKSLEALLSTNQTGFMETLFFSFLVNIE